jgi:hypothetical protein
MEMPNAMSDVSSRAVDAPESELKKNVASSPRTIKDCVTTSRRLFVSSRLGRGHSI